VIPCVTAEMTKKYYAVRKGRTPGIFMTCKHEVMIQHVLGEDCKKSVDGYPNEYKSFKTLDEAAQYLSSYTDTQSAPSTSSSKDQKDKKHQKKHRVYVSLIFDFLHHSFQDHGSHPVEYVPVYTDGACINNGNRGASGGIGVWWGPNDPR
jgi:hypothetical protein